MQMQTNAPVVLQAAYAWGGLLCTTLNGQAGEVANAPQHCDCLQVAARREQAMRESAESDMAFSHDQLGRSSVDGTQTFGTPLANNSAFLPRDLLEDSVEELGTVAIPFGATRRDQQLAAEGANCPLPPYFLTITGSRRRRGSWSWA